MRKESGVQLCLVCRTVLRGTSTSEAIGGRNVRYHYA